MIQPGWQSGTEPMCFHILINIIMNDLFFQELIIEVAKDGDILLLSPL